MRRTIVVLCMLAVPARADEVHTRSTAGTWVTDSQRGTLHGSIPNDTGFSFLPMAESVNLDAPVTIKAQVRFASHIDYSGAGVALIDPRASNKEQKNVRIELSEREDTIGVGGWAHNEDHFSSGSSRKVGRDITVGPWYELVLHIDGIHVTGSLDNVALVATDIPELRDLPRTMQLAAFVIESDVEIRVAVINAPTQVTSIPAIPVAPPVASNVRVKLEAYGHDDTDGSGVSWNAGVPKPSMDDDPARHGAPNAVWDASYDIRGNKVCVRVSNLTSPYPPTHRLSIGYSVTLEGAEFSNQSHERTIIVYQFTGRPGQNAAERCEPITIVAEPVKVHTQKELEADYKKRKAALRSADDMKREFGNLDAWVVVLDAKHKVLLDPELGQWLYFDTLHGSWEPTGIGVGAGTFQIVKGRLAVKKGTVIR